MFTGNEGDAISLALGSAMTAAYRTANPGAIKAHFFGSTILNTILAQQDCVGIRIYYALNEIGVKQLVLVGVNANGDDQTAGIIADRSEPCPSKCDTGNSTLNK